jgi:hypothetical protein
VKSPVDQTFFESRHSGIERMIGGRHIGRIEEDERVPAPADFDRVLHCGPCQHRMEQAGGCPLAEPHFHRLYDPFEIARQLLVSMMRRHNRHILSVIAKVEDYQVELCEQILPVGKLGISCKAVAMGQEQTHAVRAAVAPHKNFAPSSSATSNVKLGTGNS